MPFYFYDISMICTLTPSQLIRHTDPQQLSLQAQATDSYFGQARAVSAIQMACQMRAHTPHIFATAEAGFGQRVQISELLSTLKHTCPAPQDWVYLHNFANPKAPIAAALPAGSAPAFAKQMQDTYLTCQKKLSKKFETLRYQQTINQLKQELYSKENALINEFNALAKPYNTKLATNFLTDIDTYAALQALDNQKDIDPKAEQKLTPKLIRLNKDLGKLALAHDNALDDYHCSLAKSVLEPVFAPLLTTYSDDTLQRYLRAYYHELTHNPLTCIDDEETDTPSTIPARFSVNILTSNTAPPIVHAAMPSAASLLGSIGYLPSHNGLMTTNVSLIQAGDLHRANGGFLVLEAADLLDYPLAWQALKQALLTKTLTVTELETMNGFTGTSLTPMPIALDVKVILLGNDALYYDFMNDDSVRQLFTVRADFVSDIVRDNISEQALVNAMRAYCQATKLPTFTPAAYATVLDELARISGQQNRLSLHSDKREALLCESAYLADNAHSREVLPCHVQKAIDAQIFRQNGLAELYWQELLDGQHLISTGGQTVGQVNALSVIDDGQYAFGLPARLTARIIAKFGEGDIMDIERDVTLGGNIHAKAMLIMTSFLRGLFSEHCPLNFSASLAFEQNYAEIDGDSATLAASCALLSALADTPFAQHLAITGSMNQLGEVQAVGGINAKIEAFFKACQHQLPTDNAPLYGVIIPKANAINLMLRPDVVEAVHQGKFAIYTVEHLFDALALLSALPVSSANAKGKFAKGTLFAKIAKRLQAWDSTPKKSQEKSQKTP